MSITTIKQFKAGFLTRLSHLIVLQVLFAFGAGYLLIFNPGYADLSEHARRLLKLKLTSVAGQLVTPVEQYVDRSENQDSRARLEDSMSRILQSDPTLTELSLYWTNGTGPFRHLLTYQQTKDEDASSFSITEAIELLSRRPVSWSSDGREGMILSVSSNGESTACFFQYQVGDSGVIGLRATYEGDMIVSDRATLRYALLLLMLCSTLISLMTVYLIHKRFRDPLNQLIEGFNKTIHGEDVEQIEPVGDAELKSLTEAFNSAGMDLRDKNRQIKKCNEQLQSVNASISESEAFLKALVDYSPSIVISVEADGELILFNKRAEKEFGCVDQNMLGRNLDELFVQSISARLKHPAKDSSEGFEAICRRMDGSQFPAWVVHVEIHDEDHKKPRYLLVLSDITESKNFQEMMIGIDRFCTRGEMAGDIAHEINNYLTILSGNLELLPLLIKKNDPEKLERKLSLMRTTVDKIARFSDGLMNSGYTDAHFELSDMNQQVQNVVAFLEPQNKFDGISISVNLSGDCPPLEFDTSQTQQLLVNLIYNAAEAMAETQDNRQITISTSKSNDMGRPTVRVQVRDNGPGVPEDRVEHLFNKRFTTKRKGHGIGLVTCARILEAHGGSIHYETDNGAVFTFEFPVNRAKPEPGSPESHASKSEATA